MGIITHSGIAFPSESELVLPNFPRPAAPYVGRWAAGHVTSRILGKAELDFVPCLQIGCCQFGS